MDVPMSIAVAARLRRLTGLRFGFFTISGPPEVSGEHRGIRVCRCLLAGRRRPAPPSASGRTLESPFGAGIGVADLHGKAELAFTPIAIVMDDDLFDDQFHPA